MESYINNKKKLYTAIIQFLEGSNDDEEGENNTQTLTQIIESQELERNHEEMKQFLQIINSISNQHQRDTKFIERIMQILQFDNYEEKRQEGENDSYICSLIRQDSVEEFISYVNRSNISLSSQISPSIFETNAFLIKNDTTTLIEYSAFFGSIQIFQFLKMNKVNLKPSLWLYAIHSNNAELIHLLEHYELPKNNLQIYLESIKCHHNDIANYIKNNHINPNEKVSEKTISKYLKYHNFEYFQTKEIFKYGFFYLCKYIYNTLVNLFMNEKENEIVADKQAYHFYHSLLGKEKITEDLVKSHHLIQAAIPTSIISIGTHSFSECSTLTQIIIPFSVRKIQNFAFSNCSSLKKIVIPSSVTSIGKYSFSNCSSLRRVSLPESVKSIRDHAFDGCKSLEQIIIPIFVTSIGGYAFYKCESLAEITIPSSVATIGGRAFKFCSSLRKISFIKSSLSSINNHAFEKCKLLTNLTIPPSATSIGKYAFLNCFALKHVTIPSSVTSIGKYAFEKCFRMEQITIPSSVTSVGTGAFSLCSSLKRVSIPSSVTSIECLTFKNCFSLSQITIPSSVTSIGDRAFFGCSSLTQVTIPSSVSSIGDYAFFRCSSLTQVTIPSSVTSIGEGAFERCPSLENS